MPQASDELRLFIKKRFGSLDCEPVEKHLKERRWTFTQNGFFIAPKGEDPSDEEWDMAYFLVDEWDYSILIRKADHGT